MYACDAQVDLWHHTQRPVTYSKTCVKSLFCLVLSGRFTQVLLYSRPLDKSA